MSSERPTDPIARREQLELIQADLIMLKVCLRNAGTDPMAWCDSALERVKSLRSSLVASEDAGQKRETELLRATPTEPGTVSDQRAGDQAGSAAYKEACEQIAALSAGWDAEGLIGPKPPLSWESVGRLALDLARYAVRSS